MSPGCFPQLCSALEIICNTTQSADQTEYKISPEYWVSADNVSDYEHSWSEVVSLTSQSRFSYLSELTHFLFPIFLIKTILICHSKRSTVVTNYIIMNIPLMSPFHLNVPVSIHWALAQTLLNRAIIDVKYIISVIDEHFDKHTVTPCWNRHKYLRALKVYIQYIWFV